MAARPEAHGEIAAPAGGAVKDASVIYSSNYADLDAQAVAIMKDPSTHIAGKTGQLTVLVRWQLPARANVAEAGVIIGTAVGSETLAAIR